MRQELMMKNKISMINHTNMINNIFQEEYKESILDVVKNIISDDYILISKKKCYMDKYCLNCDQRMLNVFKSAKFCSNRCGTVYRRKTGITNRPGSLVKKQCLICSKSFYIDKVSTERHAKYCSVMCSHKGQAATRAKGLKFIKRKNFLCKYCGKENLCYPKRIRKYCNKECYWKDRKRK